MTAILSERLPIDATVIRKATRYAAVSGVGVVITQVLLVLGHSVLGLRAGLANALAVLFAAVPVYALNRAWVWKVTGPNSLRREILPFWGFTLAGLVLSTAAVAVVASMTASGLAVAAANLTAFGVLWVAKFFVLDGLVFGPGAVQPA